MKYLIIGNYGAQHLYSYIKNVIPDNKNEITILSNAGDYDPPTVAAGEYYKEQNVIYIPVNRYAEIRNKTLRYILNTITGIFKIRRLKKYEYCIIHYLSMGRMILALFLPKSVKIICVTYGSDILRNKQLSSKIYKIIFDRAYKIVFNNRNVEYTFEEQTNSKYINKSKLIMFPSESMNIIDHVINSTSREKACRFFGFPLDKVIVTCGHTATKAERHEELIENLRLLPKNIVSKVHFVFPMTYGDIGFEEYRESIRRKLVESGISFSILDKYLQYEELLSVHVASSIHITVIETDALSAFMTEELYTGSVLIYGNWLKYYEFDENDIAAVPVSSINDVHGALLKVLSMSSAELNNFTSNNKEIIYNLLGNDNIRKRWEYEVFGNNK